MKNWTKHRRTSFRPTPQVARNDVRISFLQFFIQLLRTDCADIYGAGSGEFYLKGKSFLKYDLLIKHGDGVGGRNTQSREKRLSLLLQIRLDTRI